MFLLKLWKIIRNWGVDQVDEITRREIYTAADGTVNTESFGVNLHDLDELGEGQEYQDFYRYFRNNGMLATRELLLVLILEEMTASSCQFVKKFKSSKMIHFIVRRELASMDGLSKGLLF